MYIKNALCTPAVALPTDAVLIPHTKMIASSEGEERGTSCLFIQPRQRLPKYILFFVYKFSIPLLHLWKKIFVSCLLYQPIRNLQTGGKEYKYSYEDGDLTH